MSKTEPYFSRRQNGFPEATIEKINERAWKGIRSIVVSRLQDDSFAKEFPYTCSDGGAICSTEIKNFEDRLHSIGVNIELDEIYNRTNNVPETYDILDLIEFCFRYIAKPESICYHKYYRHHHLKFDVYAGREQFVQDINNIFQCNGIAFELTERGIVQRTLTTEMVDLLSGIQPSTGDDELDKMLEHAKADFAKPKFEDRYQALKTLWGAWERVKTLDGDNKSEAVRRLLDQAASSKSPNFRMVLESEATALTTIGNAHQIRHTEPTQEPLVKAEHVDYLFYRLSALIHLILRSRDAGR